MASVVGSCPKAPDGAGTSLIRVFDSSQDSPPTGAETGGAESPRASP